MRDLLLKLSNGSVMFVPGTLQSITTYVLLEQEAWFEKELAFVARWLQPGMKLVDIGANLGVYSLPLTRRVGPGGRVLAYEPGSEPRALLLKSARQNGCDHLEVSALALSDGAREGRLSIGASSELASLSGRGGEGEAVEISSLDLDFGPRDWAPDFVKIDAEGEEERILRGGRRFFADHSPLVMFEIRAGDAVNEGLDAAFRAMGYGIYRLLGSAPLLVPAAADQSLDAFELNLFAAKPDRARALAEAGFLVAHPVDWQPDAASRDRGIALWQAQPFAASALAPLASRPLDPTYRDALAAYAHWRDVTAPLAERSGALAFSCRLLSALMARAPSFARLSTFARVAWEAGFRAKAVGALQQMIAQASQAAISINEPLWPAAPRFDAIGPGADPGTWLMAATVEQFERARHHSSLFGPPNPHLGWLCATPFASVEMLRRLALTSLRADRTPAIPRRLKIEAPDNLNAKVWQMDLVEMLWG